MVELLKRSDTMAAKNSGEAEKTLFGMSIKSSKKYTPYEYKDDDSICYESDGEYVVLCGVVLLMVPTGCENKIFSGP